MYFQMFLLFSAALKVFSTYQGCNININVDLSEPQPLLLSQGNYSSNTFIYPNSKGELFISYQQSIKIACPSGHIKLYNLTTEKAILDATCLHEKIFNINELYVPFKNITCTRKPLATARYTKEKCLEKFEEIEIGFLLEKKFIRQLLICFDKSEQNTLYSYSNLTRNIAGIQKGYPRKLFTIGIFYDVKPYKVHQLYGKEFQRRNINKLLGYKNDSYEIITEKGNFFLSRGHLSPKADFIYGSQQSLTFFYLNTAPQWQTLNGGNWLVLEKACRNFVINKQMNLQIYTGTYQKATLTHVNETVRELFLYKYRNKRALPIPKYFWKVLYEPNTQSGVAFVSLNNPYYNVTRNDVFCEDICDSIKWIQWQRNNTYLGYSFCCTVESFRKSVKTLPVLKIKNLLN